MSGVPSSAACFSTTAAGKSGVAVFGSTGSAAGGAAMVGAAGPAAWRKACQPGPH